MNDVPGHSLLFALAINVMEHHLNWFYVGEDAHVEVVMVEDLTGGGGELTVHTCAGVYASVCVCVIRFILYISKWLSVCVYDVFLGSETIDTLDRHESKRLYKIDHLNTELYCKLQKKKV